MIKEKRGSENVTTQVQQLPRTLNPKELDTLKRKLEELMNWTFSYKEALEEKVLEYRKQFMSHPEIIEGVDKCKEKLAKFDIVVEQTFKFVDDLVLAMRNMLDIIKQQVKMNMQEAKINQQEMLVFQQEVTINQQEMKINQQEMTIAQQEVKINQQEAKINEQKFMANQQAVIINEQEAKISQLEVYLENLKNSHTRVNIYRTYRDWVGKFRRLLVTKVNEKLNKNRKNRRFNDWFALEKRLDRERSARKKKGKVMTEHLESVLQEFGMTMNDFNLLSDLKAVSNFTFHNNDQTVKDAKNYLNKIVFPEDMALLKNPLQKALDAIEKEHVDDYVDDDDDDDDDEEQ